MVTKTIRMDMHTSLQELLAQVRQGVEVILMEGDKPLARITPEPVQPQSRRKPDLFPDAIRTRDDFDDPLPDNFWLGDDR